MASVSSRPTIMAPASTVLGSKARPDHPSHGFEAMPALDLLVIDDIPLLSSSNFNEA